MADRIPCQWTTLHYLNITRSGNLAVITNDSFLFTFSGHRFNHCPMKRRAIFPDRTLTPWTIDSQPVHSIKVCSGLIGKWL